MAADCQVLEAVLAFLHQDWSSCMKGAWVLRKAWKIYQKTYGHIRGLYMREIGLRENSLGEKMTIIGDIIVSLTVFKTFFFSSASANFWSANKSVPVNAASNTRSSSSSNCSHIINSQEGSSYRSQ